MGTSSSINLNHSRHIHISVPNDPTKEELWISLKTQLSNYGFNVSTTNYKNINIKNCEMVLIFLTEKTLTSYDQLKEIDECFIEVKRILYLNTNAESCFVKGECMDVREVKDIDKVITYLGNNFAKHI